jgi:transposase-like protein
VYTSFSQTLFITTLSVFILSIIIEHWIMILITLSLGIISFFIKCPKCNKRLHISKNGIYRPASLRCDKCKYNFMKCK